MAGKTLPEFLTITKVYKASETSKGDVIKAGKQAIETKGGDVKEIALTTHEHAGGISVALFTAPKL